MIGASGNAIACQLFEQSELDSKKRPETVSWSWCSPRENLM